MLDCNSYTRTCCCTVLFHSILILILVILTCGIIPALSVFYTVHCNFVFRRLIVGDAHGRVCPQWTVSASGGQCICITVYVHEYCTRGVHKGTHVTCVLLGVQQGGGGMMEHW